MIGGPLYVDYHKLKLGLEPVDITVRSSPGFGVTTIDLCVLWPSLHRASVLWGSASMMRTDAPCPASVVPTTKHVVDLPLPPLGFAATITGTLPLREEDNT